ncbi:hypothetical protein BASA81_011112 [Batrachochytrium salamandrivorans]|nr:hypothetical protein BASA81_011112 [Batrachochytrium salamandrivorans]
MTQERDLESGAAATVLTAIPVPDAAPAVTTESVKSLFCQRLESIKMVLGVSTLAAFVQGLSKEVPALVKLSEYSKPKTSDEVKQRFQANVKFFKFTYTSVCALVALMFVLSSPVLIILGAALAFLWMWVLGKASDANAGTVIAGREFGHRERMFAASTATLLYVVLGGVISTLVYIVVVNVLVIGSHASLREPVVLDELEVMANETDAIIQGDGGA